VSDLFYKLTIKAQDGQATPVVGRFEAAIKALTGSLKKAKGPEDQLADKTDDLADKAGDGGQKMRKLAESIGSVGKASGKAEGPVGKLAGKIGKVAGGLAWKGLLVGGGLLAAFAGHVIKITAEFEQFEASLIGTEGSAKAARKAMDWIQSFAEKTPYELAEVTNAFIALRQLGADPTNGLLLSLGDASGALGKTLDQSVQMMLDAQHGDYERLKEFGIVASAQGKKVKLTWMANGKEMTLSTSKNAVAITKALTGIFDSKFKGGMERQSKTFNGMLSNLADAFHSFEVRVGRAGLFDLMKDKLQKLLDWIGKAAEDGTLQKWAEKISGSIVSMATGISDALGKVDWPKLAHDIGTLAGAISGLAGAFEKLSKFDETSRRWGLQGWGAKMGQDEADRYAKSLGYGPDGKKPTGTPPGAGAKRPPGVPKATPAGVTPSAYIKPPPAEAKLEITIKDPGRNAEVGRPSSGSRGFVVTTNRGLHSAGFAT
jgi:hypothetical protein